MVIQSSNSRNAICTSTPSIMNGHASPTIRACTRATGTINGKLNKAITDQLITVSKLRMINQMGKISRYDMWQVERAIRVQLALSNHNRGKV
ncbi:hypothetical protein HOD41_08785 [bacterium]|nr:hypothetical protein [bacterium]MBT4512704.1 hypothetical protein [Chloroflexota bacterium]